jgi:hypothetical protein
MSGLELGLRDPRPDQPSSFTDHNSQSAVLVSGFWFLVSGFWFLVSGFWFLKYPRLDPLDVWQSSRRPCLSTRPIQGHQAWLSRLHLTAG